MTELRHDEILMADGFLSSWFSAAKDTFSPIPYPVQALSFDHIGDGHPITSHFALFRLPVELHSCILRHLNNVDLANLALVDDDCLQLARSAQFAVVHLSINQPSMQLITHIFGESVGVDQSNNVRRRRRRIGPCVRRVIIASNFSHAVAIVHDGGSDPEALLQNAMEMHDALLSLVSSCVALAFPNLELFQFFDKTSIGHDFFQQLSSVHLRHLALDNFWLEEDTGSNTRKRISSESIHTIIPSWSDMQSLRVNFLSEPPWEFSDLETTKAALLSMLHSVSGSVEGLMLGRMNHLGPEFARSVSDFPRLQRLHLEEYMLNGEDDGSLFLSKILPLGGTARNSLHSLQLDRVDSAHLIRLGHLTQLTKLVINDYSLKHRTEDPNFAFLAANPQLELLSFTFPIKSRMLRDSILPILHTSGFTALRVLRVASASSYFSRRALAAIGMISSLEMLWLSAGQQCGWQYDWFIDHIHLKRGLRPLQRLRELAFTRDSYHCMTFRTNERDEVRLGYYSFPVLPPRVFERDFISSEDEEHLEMLALQVQVQSGQSAFMQRSTYIWEKWHRGKMLVLAEEYAAMFPRLEFAFLGEYPMEIVEGEIALVQGPNAASRSRRVVLLSKVRNSYLTELNFKWGGQTI